MTLLTCLCKMRLGYCPIWSPAAGLRETPNYKDGTRLYVPYVSFEDLDVWKWASDLTANVYQQLKECRDFGLHDQMTRAAVSIPSNIGEGAERNSDLECARFVHIAKGSATELRTQLMIASRVGVMATEVANELIDETKIISVMLHKLAVTCKNRANRNP